MVTKDAELRALVVKAAAMEQPGISLFDEEGRTIVKIEGSARVEMAVLLKQNLMQTQITRGVGIDWGGAEHVDACVLQLLLALRKVLAERGLPFVVDNDNPKVRGYLKLSGLSECFPVRLDPQGPPTEGSDA